MHATTTLATRHLRRVGVLVALFVVALAGLPVDAAAGSQLEERIRSAIDRAGLRSSPVAVSVRDVVAQLDRGKVTRSWSAAVARHSVSFVVLTPVPREGGAPLRGLT